MEGGRVDEEGCRLTKLHRKKECLIRKDITHVKYISRVVEKL